jgi:hypothetical protein
MRSGPRSAACVIACASLASGVVSATVFRATQVPFTLTPEEFAYVEKLGCRDPHGLGLDHGTGVSWTEVNHDDMWVEGECRSHRAIAGYPVKYSIDCRHQKGEWSCGEDRETLFAEVDGKRVQVRTAVAEVSLERAFRIVVYMESLDVWEPHIPDRRSEFEPPYEYFDVQSLQGDVVNLYIQASGNREIRVIRSAAGETYQLVR